MRIIEARFNFFEGVQKVRILPKTRKTIIIGRNGSGKTTLLKTLYEYFKEERILEEDEAVKTDSDFTRLAFVGTAVGAKLGKASLKAPVLGKVNAYFDIPDILKKAISDFGLNPNMVKESVAGGQTRLYAILEAAAKISPDGVLLVDELERHLEIEIQSLLVGILGKLLPEGHLIGTTHAPYILSDHEDDEILSL